MHDYTEVIELVTSVAAVIELVVTSGAAVVELVVSSVAAVTELAAVAERISSAGPIWSASFNGTVGRCLQLR